MFRTRLQGRSIVLTVPGVDGPVTIRIEGAELNPHAQVSIDAPRAVQIRVVDPRPPSTPR